MSNHHLRDSRLSMKAKGLLSQMLSLPEDWDYSIAGLVKINPDGETAVNSALRELRRCGYLVVDKIMPGKSASGRIEYVYTVYETPEQGLEIQGVENLVVENQGVENQGQLNTNNQLLKNKILNNKILTKNDRNSRFVPPSIQEVNEYCRNRGNTINAERFVDYYQQSGWKLSNGVPMKDWKAAVRNWERQPWNEKTTSGKAGTDYKKELEGIF